MKPPPFLVVADRGHMKAYHFKKAVGRAPAAKLAEKLDLEEACLKYKERFTDQAGAFPSGAALGMANGVAEHMSLEKENKTRIYRHLAEHLEAWLRRHRPRSWWFAAPSEINNAILEELAQDDRRKLVHNVKQDLVHVPAVQLLKHMSSKISRDYSLPVAG